MIWPIDGFDWFGGLTIAIGVASLLWAMRRRA
jgi:hypothetical protein